MIEKEAPSGLSSNRIEKVLGYRVAVKFLLKAVLELHNHARLTDELEKKLREMLRG